MLHAHESRRGSRGEPLGWADILIAFRRHRLVGLVTGLLVVVAVAVWALISPDIYLGQVSILPSAQSSLPGVFGAFPGIRDVLDGNDSSFEQFYAEIATSDTVLDPLLERTWPNQSGDPAILAVLFDLDDQPAGTSGQLVKERVKKRLRRKIISLDRDNLDGFMRLNCRIPGDPILAAALANAIADGLEAFNTVTSQQRAQQQRQFIGQRLTVVSEEVQAAEGLLTEFVSSHRGYRESPELTQRYRELQREADAATTMWVELKRQYELSRVEEQRNLNSLTVLDRAAVPVEPAGPNRPFMIALGVFFGIVLGMTVVLFRHFVLTGLTGRSG